MGSENSKNNLSKNFSAKKIIKATKAEKTTRLLQTYFLTFSLNWQLSAAKKKKIKNLFKEAFIYLKKHSLSGQKLLSNSKILKPHSPKLLAKTKMESTEPNSSTLYSILLTYYLNSWHKKIFLPIFNRYLNLSNPASTDSPPIYFRLTTLIYLYL